MSLSLYIYIYIYIMFVIRNLDWSRKHDNLKYEHARIFLLSVGV